MDNKYDTFNPKINEDDDGIISIPSHGSDMVDFHKRPDKRRSRKKNIDNNLKKATEGKKETFFHRIELFFKQSTVKAIIGIFFGFLGLFLCLAFISFISHGAADQSAVENLAIGTIKTVSNSTGEGGARASQFLLNDLFGLGSIVIIFWLLAMCLKLLIGKPKFKTVSFTIKCLIALIAVSLIAGLLTIEISSWVNLGGNHGRYINLFIIDFLGWPGAIILCLFVISVFFILCINDIRRWYSIISQKRILEKTVLQEEIERQQKIENMDNPDEENMPEEEVQTEDIEFDDTVDETSDNTNEDSEQHDNPDKQKNDSMIVNVNDVEVAEKPISGSGNYNHRAELSKFKFPPIELLKESDTQISINRAEQLENQDRIRKTLLDFGIPITSIEATVGPTITLYEIVPDKGVKIARIRNLVDDIALSLAAVGVRIIAPIPGKGTVGIEVANKDPKTVSMRTIITSRAYQDSKYKLPIALGSTISNEVYIADLAKMPHLLVAGATGQGKSVGLNVIITSLLYRKHPSELKFVLIDPKMVEFSLYSILEKHYLAKLPDEEEPIITDPQKVVSTLSSLCVEMDNRYNLLKNAGTRNIEEYNAKFSKKVLNPEKGHKYLPYIVVIVDEFSDLIMTAGKDVEMPIARIAQKARAVGMHMIIATQRPSTNVITGIIKGNFPARMAFKVASGVDSKTILDTTGAQQLIGRGDMLLSNGDMTRVQCAFIDTPEVEKICECIASQPGYPHAYLLPEPLIDTEGNNVGNDSAGGEHDPLAEEIARWIVNGSTASTSSLQRRYNIGYNRAGRIMDQLERDGIVGASQGGKPRAVLVDPIGLESIINSWNSH